MAKSRDSNLVRVDTCDWWPLTVAVFRLSFHRSYSDVSGMFVTLSYAIVERNKVLKDL